MSRHVECPWCDETIWIDEYEPGEYKVTHESEGCPIDEHHVLCSEETIKRYTRPPCAACAVKDEALHQCGLYANDDINALCSEDLIHDEINPALSTTPEVLAVVESKTQPGVASFVAGDPVPCANFQIELSGDAGIGTPIDIIILRRSRPDNGEEKQDA